jgi:hypothetical protein
MMGSSMVCLLAFSVLAFGEGSYIYRCCRCSLRLASPSHCMPYLHFMLFKYLGCSLLTVL